MSHQSKDSGRQPVKTLTRKGVQPDEERLKRRRAYRLHRKALKLLKGAVVQLIKGGRRRSFGGTEGEVKPAVTKSRLRHQTYITLTTRWPATSRGKKKGKLITTSLPGEKTELRECIAALSPSRRKPKES